MPITWAKFRFGEDGSPTEVWMRKIQTFLREHPRLAYSEPELRTALSCSSSDDDGRNFVEALYWLTALGGIVEGLVSGETYYKYAEDIPELPAKVGATI